jgi:hypothetical protein
MSGQILRLCADKKGLLMTHRWLAGVAAISLVFVSFTGIPLAEASDDIVVEGASSPPPPPAASGDGPNRLLDVEAAIGAIIGAESDPPVDDNLLYGGSVAVRLIDRLDAELGFVVGDTKTRDDLADEHQMVKYLYGGLRYYPYFPVNGVARPYVFFGPTQFWDLENSETDTGVMPGFGIRFQPGETFGFTVKLPVVIAVTGGDANTMMLPTFNLYWQFNLGGGEPS